MNIIHTTNPLHLIIRFKFFGNSLTLCHLFYEPKKHILSLLVDLGKVVIEFSGGEQIGV